jgi:hypothetical protein
MGEENVNAANLKDIKKYVKAYQGDHGHEFPHDLINIVLCDDDGLTACRMATVESTEVEGAEGIAREFADPIHSDETPPGPPADPTSRCLLSEHVLNQAEADELIAMGITRVLSWNDGKDPHYLPGTHFHRYDRVPVDKGIRVIMIGGGAVSETAGIVSHSGFDDEGDADKIGDAELLFRIVLGIGQECALVKEGYIENAPLCPQGIKNSRYTYNYYSIVLPRLQASVDRLTAASPFDDDDGDGWLDVDVIDDASADDGDGQVKRIQLKPQSWWDFEVVNATGHIWPEDVKWWRMISFDWNDGNGPSGGT